MITGLIKYKDFSWTVHRKVRDKEGVEITRLKELWNVDIALRKNGYIYFCNIVEDFEFEEIKEDGKDNNNV